MQGSFPLLFIALFLSSAFFPRETMSGAYAAIADANPVSYLAEGLRALTIEPLGAGALMQSVLIPIAIAVASISLALAALSSRISAR